MSVFVGIGRSLRISARIRVEEYLGLGAFLDFGVGLAASRVVS
jgi:hypothetical protein